MKVTRANKPTSGFRPYTLTIHINNEQDDGSLRTVAARMTVIPTHLRKDNHPFLSGATEQSVHDLLSALHKASIRTRP
jgi:hypothetical protein